MTVLYPLTFQPVFKQYLWGGRRLASLGKAIGPGEHYAESWEVVDHGEDQSVIEEGPLRGMTLNELCRQHSAELLGRHAPQGQFPLLFKFLDAQKNLSVQVHPNDQQAARLNPPDRGKTEAWLVLQSEPGSALYAGLKPEFDGAAFRREVEQGTVERCLHRFEPNAGDCVFIPAGTVHALGAGMLVAEIQQASNTTFRVFDWNRVGDDGQPRPLHVDQAMEVIDFESGPVSPQPPQPTEASHIERLVQCRHFVLDRWRFESSRQRACDNRFHLLVMIGGRLSVRVESLRPVQLSAGQTALLPAGCSTCELVPESPVTMLDIYLP